MILSARNIDKRYGRDGAVLRDLSLDLKRGDFCAIEGRSGSGKTTLLNLIGGLDAPDRGALSVDGRDLDEMSERERCRFRNRSIGFVFQMFRLHPGLTALENVMLPGMVGGLKSAEARRRAEEWLERLELSPLAHRKPATFSGGQSQRLAVARALLMKPALLLADEPTGNLDEQSGLDLMQLLARLNRDESLTILMTTHETVARRFATRNLRLHDGRLES